MNQGRAGAAVEFRDRDRCVNCGSSSFTPIWSARFSDEAVGTHLRRGGYSVDLDELLGDAEVRLVRCHHCAMMFHRRVLTPEWLEVLYSQWIDSRQIENFGAHRRGRAGSTRFDDFELGRQFVKHGLRLDAYLRAGFPSAERFTLLDFGCGDAEFVACLRHLGFRTFGIDASASRFERSEERGVTILRSLAEFRAADPGPLHAVSLFQNLEHLDEPRRVLNELVDCLLPGGIVIVEVPDCSAISGPPKTVEEFHNVHPLEHINNFTPATLTAFCEASGLTAVARIPAHVTTSVRDVVRTEATRIVKPRRTNQYFRKA